MMLRVVLAFLLTAALPVASATFVVPVTGDLESESEDGGTTTLLLNLDGYTDQGFTFHGNWQNYGEDTRNAPLMENYTLDHSVTFNQGEEDTFTFENMILSGWPSDNYEYVSGDGWLNFDFKDANGGLIAHRRMFLPCDNSWHLFKEIIPGVHEILFYATGFFSFDEAENVIGFWPRLGGINVPEPVPEGGFSALLLGVGLLSLPLLRRRISC